jgi:hypothetical protein
MGRKRHPFFGTYCACTPTVIANLFQHKVFAIIILIPDSYYKYRRYLMRDVSICLFRVEGLESIVVSDRDGVTLVEGKYYLLIHVCSDLINESEWCSSFRFCSKCYNQASFFGDIFYC